MNLDVDLAEQTSSDDLPNQTQNQVLPAFDKVLGTNVDYRASDTLGGGDNDVVIFSHLESVEWTGLAGFD